jgi:hypothetical protein
MTSSNMMSSSSSAERNKEESGQGGVLHTIEVEKGTDGQQTSIKFTFTPQTLSLPPLLFLCLCQHHTAQDEKSLNKTRKWAGTVDRMSRRTSSLQVKSPRKSNAPTFVSLSLFLSLLLRHKGLSGRLPILRVDECRDKLL